MTDPDSDDRVLDAQVAAWGVASQVLPTNARDDADLDFVPLQAPIYHRRARSRQRLGAAAVATALFLALWLLAEIAYANGNAGGWWDEVWYAAAAISIIALAGWAVAGVRWLQSRGRA